MPLVSGVCRVASAPMLSHGGSRLNASKPEANPKTSCPKNFLDQRRDHEASFLQSVVLVAGGNVGMEKTLTSNRIASQTIPASSWLDGAKYMKNSRDFSFSKTVTFACAMTRCESCRPKKVESTGSFFYQQTNTITFPYKR
jgi:hypothetical protein